MELIDYIKIAAQIVIAVSIYNVWFLRFNKPTIYRWKDAQNMREEFISYGLPDALVWIVGALKVVFATMLVIGIYYQPLIFPAAVGMAALMLGAIIMHLKVKDQPIKSLPAAIFLILSLSIAFL